MFLEELLEEERYILEATPEALVSKVKGPSELERSLQQQLHEEQQTHSVTLRKLSQTTQELQSLIERSAKADAQYRQRCISLEQEVSSSLRIIAHLRSENERLSQTCQDFRMNEKMQNPRSQHTEHNSNVGQWSLPHLSNTSWNSSYTHQQTLTPAYNSPNYNENNNKNTINHYQSKPNVTCTNKTPNFYPPNNQPLPQITNNQFKLLNARRPETWEKMLNPTPSPNTSFQSNVPKDSLRHIIDL